MLAFLLEILAVWIELLNCITFFCFGEKQINILRNRFDTVNLFMDIETLKKML